VTQSNQAMPQRQRNALRRQLLECRNTLEPELKRARDAAIGAHVLAHRALAPAARAVVGIHWPVRGEPDLRPAYAALAARGAQLALPVIIDHAAPLKFARWSPDAALVEGVFGVPVPATMAWVQPEVLLIPCLGFSAERFRLGYGGGFYDRTLEPLPRPTTIGIAYACALVEFEPAPHDIALDCILTENGCW
jgi:5-formyltetrahydrofolate cyclo-ligase